MNWLIPDDTTRPIITAEEHIKSSHGSGKSELLPSTCVIFQIGMALKYIETHYETVTLSERLPCFLDNPKCIAIKEYPDICFTRGGYGSPAAVDTLETVKSMGVKRIIVVGMCGGFSENINVGDVVVPSKVLSEEGTSRHYFKDIEFAEPNFELLNEAKLFFADKFTTLIDGTVTSDAVYRQTFAKESYWRENGCVGVDMEASALLAIARYYHMPAVAVLLCSDKHPMRENTLKWNWGNINFKETREKFVEQAVAFALQLKQNGVKYV
ncbi:MAG: nucleoside phosphorylase [Candidatus Fimenecus sp.]